MGRKKKVVEGAEPQAIQIKILTNYLAEVKVFQLNPPFNEKGVNFEYIMVANSKPMTGKRNFNIWPCNKEGVPSMTLPLRTLKASQFTDALKALGYKCQN